MEDIHVTCKEADIEAARRGMTVYDMIEMLRNVKDKSKEVVIEDLDYLDKEAVIPVWVDEFNNSVTIWISS